MEPASLPTPPAAVASAPAKGGIRPAAGPGQPPSPSTTPSKIAPPPALIPRIVQAATLVPTLQGKSFRIALSPDHLGDLLIELTYQGSLLQASIRTETDAARDLIVSQLDQLRASLEGQGIQVGEFQVNVDGSAPEASLPAAGTGERPAMAEAAARLRSARPQLLDLEA